MNNLINWIKTSTWRSFAPASMISDTTMLAGILSAALASSVVQAGEADVIEATITALGGQKYLITATVSHADTGWDHYADRWDVLSIDGNLLGSRTLHHPHVDEQPFTRSLTIELPAGTQQILIQAHDSVDGLGGSRIELAVPDSNG